MNLYEFESKKILKKYNLPLLNSYLTNKILFLKNKIYKIQAHSGYRGKHNGIVFINNYKTCVFFFNKWKNNLFFNKKIKKFLIEDFIFIEKEIYLSFFINNNYINFVISEKGGINIENQKKINFLKLKINFLILTFTIFDYLSNCFLNNLIIKKIILIIYKIYKLFFLNKIILIEINPLIINNNNLYILDCKIIIEKINIVNFSDKISKILKINYIQLKGKICCIVNGAGLALTTLDYFNYNNAQCFNFIDLSGKINDLQMIYLFNFILTKKIKILFINLFGGIVSCKKILNSLLNYMYLNFEHKIIIRLEGNFSNFTKKKLINFKNLIIIEKLNDSIKKSIILSYV
ncbi:ATP-grasp domain-containing protein [Candidatus Carsonella ruddii]|uniref:ATP-grasp domain-containing protein n=1 Tax=Carsonella ruddii TaxID=114186 RepID=UPI003D3E744C